MFEGVFDFTMEPIQLYALSFLLGSFSVATLSDMKRMSAQSEFVSVWAIIAIGLFIIDVYLVGTDKLAWDIFGLKWILIIIFSLLSHERVGVYFHLATGDVVAMMSAAAIMGPLGVVIFYILVKLVDWVTRPIWKSFGTETAYPFMPPIFLTTAIVLFLAWFISEQGLLG
ncbi:MAG: hypothetical protein KAJ35_02440 [Thermoplasmata archaeon]|nr:hypothetical protein [Thermoplasmata archaeon]